MAGVAVDQELKKAFSDLQIQVVNTRDKIRQYQNEIDIMQRATSGMKITNNTLKTIGKEHRTFEAIGRTFVLRDRDFLVNKIGTLVEENEGKMKSLEKSQDYQKDKQQESENNLRELLNKKQYGQK